MVEDKHNQIYTGLFEYMKDLYPKLKGGTTYNENEVKLPFLCFYQLDAPTRAMDLSNNEVVVNLVFQIEVYTDLGSNQARKMANDVRRYMLSQGFRCRNFMPLSTKTKVSRFVGRYERLDV